MIPRIKYIEPQNGYKLYAEFDDGRKVKYDLSDDIAKLPNYSMLAEINGLFFKPRLTAAALSYIGTNLLTFQAIQFMNTEKRYNLSHAETVKKIKNLAKIKDYHPKDLARFLLPVAHRNSSKSSGWILSISTLPTGNDVP